MTSGKGETDMKKANGIHCRLFEAGTMSAVLLVLLFIANAAFAADLMHNSKDTGSTRWNGRWGIAGGRYGEFT